jgi:hypothetical protein
MFCDAGVTQRYDERRATELLNLGVKSLLRPPVPGREAMPPELCEKVLSRLIVRALREQLSAIRCKVAARPFRQELPLRSDC